MRARCLVAELKRVKLMAMHANVRALLATNTMMSSSASSLQLPKQASQASAASSHAIARLRKLTASTLTASDNQQMTTKLACMLP